MVIGSRNSALGRDKVAGRWRRSEETEKGKERRRKEKRRVGREDNIDMMAKKGVKVLL